MITKKLYSKNVEAEDGLDLQAISSAWPEPGEAAKILPSMLKSARKSAARLKAPTLSAAVSALSAAAKAARSGGNRVEGAIFSRNARKEIEPTIKREE